MPTLRRRGDADLCRCGHPRAAHEHHRPGTDCALCPAGACHRFRRRTGLGWFRLGWFRRG